MFEIILFILILAVVFAAKAFSVMRWSEDNIANSTAFSWTKPGVEAPVAEEQPAPQAVAVRSTSWTPSSAAAHLHGNRWAMPAAR